MLYWFRHVTLPPQLPPVLARLIAFSRLPWRPGTGGLQCRTAMAASGSESLRIDSLLFEKSEICKKAPDVDHGHA